MRIVYLAAGAAGRYCGNCLQDTALARAMRALGKDFLLVPVYTPLRTELDDPSEPRVFYNGLRVFLEERWSFFRRPHRFLDKLLGSRSLLKLLSLFDPATDPHHLGALTVSVLRGEHGHQAKELKELTAWLSREARPDIVHLTNALLIGMARGIREATKARIACGLQSEDLFVESLPPGSRDQVLDAISGASEYVDIFVAPSAYYRRRAAEFFGLPEERIRIVRPGIALEGFGQVIPAHRPARSARVGFLARVAPEKGLHILCEAFAELARRPGFEEIELHVAGYAGKRERPYVRRLLRRLSENGLGRRARFFGTVDREAKLSFLCGIDVASVPCAHPEAKGLFVLEALAAGVPFVGPREGAIAELIEDTGGGILYEPNEPGALGEALAGLLADEATRRRLGEEGRRAVFERYGAEAMAHRVLDLYEELLAASPT